MIPMVGLFLIPLIWGVGFLAARWGLDAMGPFWLVEGRFLIAALLSAPFFPWKTFREWKGASIAAFLLLLGILLQTLGIAHTTLAKSAFLTATYALFIPAIGALFLKQRIPALEWGLLLGALLGVGLMCDLRLSSLNGGDLLTLGGALTFAVHILWLGRCATASTSPIAFTMAQIALAALMGLPVAFLLEGLPLVGSFGPLPIGGLLFLALMNTLVSFALQMNVQRAFPAHVVGAAFLLESPIAALAGWLVLNEPLSAAGLTGASIILVCAFWMGGRSAGIPEPVPVKAAAA